MKKLGKKIQDSKESLEAYSNAFSIVCSSKCDWATNCSHNTGMMVSDMYN